jgi:hypothetical protein
MTAPQARETDAEPGGAPDGDATAVSPRPAPRTSDEAGASSVDDGRVRRPGPPRPGSARTSGTRSGGERTAAGKSPAAAKAPAGKTRKARLALKRIDPWSVFLFSLLASVFAGIALIVAVFALFSVLQAMGVVTSVNELVTEVTGDGPPLLTTSRMVFGASILATANVVLLTLLATLGALLYNVCASFTGGIELTLGERDG